MAVQSRLSPVSKTKDFYSSMYVTMHSVLVAECFFIDNPQFYSLHLNSDCPEKPWKCLNFLQIRILNVIFFAYCCVGLVQEYPNQQIYEPGGWKGFHIHNLSLASNSRKIKNLPDSKCFFSGCDSRFWLADEILKFMR